MGRWARRWNRTVISFSVMATSAGMSMRSRNLARLGIVVAAHAAGHEAIEPRCENEQHHVEVDLESDR
jgi:hypothetical protein